jgi:hypothetical protein
MVRDETRKIKVKGKVKLFKMIPGKKFTSRDMAANYAKSILDDGDYAIMKTGPSTWRTYKRIDAKFKSQKEQEAAEAKLKVPVKKQVEAPFTSVIEKHEDESIEKETPSDISAIASSVDRLSASIDKLATSIFGCNELLLNVLHSMKETHATNFTPDVEKYFSEISEQEKAREEAEEPEEYEEPEPEHEHIPEPEPIEEEPEPIEEEPEEDVFATPINIKIISRLRRMFGPKHPDDQWTTPLDLGQAIKRRQHVVTGALEELQDAGFITLEGDDENMKIRLTEQGWTVELP